MAAGIGHSHAVDKERIVLSRRPGFFDLEERVVERTIPLAALAIYGVVDFERTT